VIIGRSNPLDKLPNSHHYSIFPGFNPFTREKEEQNEEDTIFAKAYKEDSAED